MEMRGINLRTSRMQSERSTIWATSPWFLQQQTLNFPSSIIVKIKNIKILITNSLVWWCGASIIVKMKKYNSKLNTFFWRWGYQSMYNSHAKRALYHLSYISTIFTSRNPKCLVLNNSENEKKYHYSLCHK